MLFISDGSIFSSAIILFAAGPNLLVSGSWISGSEEPSLISGFACSESPSLNSAINSELLTISPSCLTIFVIVPLTGATTSKTT